MPVGFTCSSRPPALGPAAGDTEPRGRKSCSCWAAIRKSAWRAHIGTRHHGLKGPDRSERRPQANRCGPSDRAGNDVRGGSAGWRARQQSSWVAVHANDVLNNLERDVFSSRPYTASRSRRDTRRAIRLYRFVERWSANQETAMSAGIAAGRPCATGRGRGIGGASHDHARVASFRVVDIAALDASDHELGRAR